MIIITYRNLSFFVFIRIKGYYVNIIGGKDMQRDCEDKYLWTVPVSYTTEEKKPVFFTEPDMTAHQKDEVNDRWLQWYELIDR